VAAKLDEVFFDSATRKTEDAADVGGALSFLDPRQTLKLTISDQPGRK
jgi:hypothetical protein